MLLLCSAIYAFSRRYDVSRAWKLFYLLLGVLALTFTESIVNEVYLLVNVSGHQSASESIWLACIFVKDAASTAFLGVLLVLASGFCITRGDFGPHASKVYWVPIIVLGTGLVSDYTFYELQDNVSNDGYAINDMTQLEMTVWFVCSVINLVTLVMAWVYTFDILQQEMLGLDAAQKGHSSRNFALDEDPRIANAHLDAVEVNDKLWDLYTRRRSPEDLESGGSRGSSPRRQQQQQQWTGARCLAQARLGKLATARAFQRRAAGLAGTLGRRSRGGRPGPRYADAERCAGSCRMRRPGPGPGLLALAAPAGPTSWARFGWSARLELRFARRDETTRAVHRHHAGPLRVQRMLYPEGAGMLRGVVHRSKLFWTGPGHNSHGHRGRGLGMASVTVVVLLPVFIDITVQKIIKVLQFVINFGFLAALIWIFRPAYENPYLMVGLSEADADDGGVGNLSTEVAMTELDGGGGGSMQQQLDEDEDEDDLLAITHQSQVNPFRQGLPQHNGGGGPQQQGRWQQGSTGGSSKPGVPGFYSSKVSGGAPSTAGAGSSSLPVSTRALSTGSSMGAPGGVGSSAASRGASTWQQQPPPSSGSTAAAAAAATKQQLHALVVPPPRQASGSATRPAGLQVKTSGAPGTGPAFTIAGEEAEEDGGPDLMDLDWKRAMAAGAAAAAAAQAAAKQR
ncbi:MAG: hypothetical protein WDW36_009427 [Sanguina aurantia]